MGAVGGGPREDQDRQTPTHKERRPGSKGGGNEAGTHTKEHVTSAGSAPGAARPWGQLQAPCWGPAISTSLPWLP